jgi:hypothetical protein
MFVTVRTLRAWSADANSTLFGNKVDNVSEPLKSSFNNACQAVAQAQQPQISQELQRTRVCTWASRSLAGPFISGVEVISPGPRIVVLASSTASQPWDSQDSSCYGHG